MSSSKKVEIVDFRPEHRDAFRDLNLAWIQAYFEVEEHDRQQLFEPEKHILDPGGAILVAQSGDVVVAVCALVFETPGQYEVAKMATRKDLRGGGIGRQLLEAVIARGRALGAHKLTLVSNSSLTPALALYRSVGFIDSEIPDGIDYARCDIALELPLASMD